MTLEMELNTYSMPLISTVPVPIVQQRPEVVSKARYKAPGPAWLCRPPQTSLYEQKLDKDVRF
jgi:hypothetical protein